MPKGTPVENWKELIEFIDRQWLAKKKRKYPFGGQDVKLLKMLCRYFTVPEIMALFSVYLTDSPFWGTRSGYLVAGMFQERAVLIDNPKFKKLAEEYQKKLQGDLGQQASLFFDDLRSHAI